MGRDQRSLLTKFLGEQREPVPPARICFACYTHWRASWRCLCRHTHDILSCAAKKEHDSGLSCEMRPLLVLWLVLCIPTTSSELWDYDGGWNCTNTVRASDDMYNRDELGRMPEADEGEIRAIDVRTNLSFLEYMEEYFAYGRPVIVSDATDGPEWALFDVAGPDPWSLEGDVLFKRWMVQIFGNQTNYERQSDVQPDGMECAQDHNPNHHPNSIPNPNPNLNP